MLANEQRALGADNMKGSKMYYFAYATHIVNMQSWLPLSITKLHITFHPGRTIVPNSVGKHPIDDVPNIFSLLPLEEKSVNYQRQQDNDECLYKN